MKKIVTVQGEGLEALLGKEVVIFCLNYIYSGKLTGVNDLDIILENAGIVYNTGPLDGNLKKDFQKFTQKEWRVRTSVIESYGEAQ